MTARFIIGIDLGTTNSVLAYTPLDGERPMLELLPIPQLVSHGTVESNTGLPSFLYLPPEHESSQGGFDLPWRKKGEFAVGEWARRQSADHPERTVDYGATGRVRLTTLTKEFFMPRFLERDEAIRRAPREPYAWDGVAEVRPFGAMEKTIVEGVY